MDRIKVFLSTLIAALLGLGGLFLKWFSWENMAGFQLLKLFDRNYGFGGFFTGWAMVAIIILFLLVLISSIRQLINPSIGSQDAPNYTVFGIIIMGCTVLVGIIASLYTKTFQIPRLGFYFSLLGGAVVLVAGLLIKQDIKVQMEQRKLRRQQRNLERRMLEQHHQNADEMQVQAEGLEEPTPME